MDRFQSISVVEEQYKVRDLDAAIRYYRRLFQFPQSLQKTTLRVFKDQLEYPVPSGYDALAFFDNKQKKWDRDFRQAYTSIKEFYEDPNVYNDVADIWDGNDRFLGVRYDSGKATSQLVSGAEDVSKYTGSGDAGTPVLDSVFFWEGSSSVRFPVTLNTNSATFTWSFDTISDSNYKQKYFFVKMYFPTVPTSVSLRFGNDSSNYLSTSVTTQFSGQSFKAGDLNILAIDLNTATTTGTITTSSFDYAAAVVSGVTTGNYYVDSSYLKGWELLDLWYYSKNLIALTGSTTANQEYFMNSSGVYATDSSFVGETEFVDVIRYQALQLTAIDRKDKDLLALFKEKTVDAEAALFSEFPSLRPNVTTSTYNFGTDFTQPSGRIN